MGKARAYGWTTIGAVQKQTFPSSVTAVAAKKDCNLKNRSISLYVIN
jgi:hypothetical protein